MYVILTMETRAVHVGSISPRRLQSMLIVIERLGEVRGGREGEGAGPTFLTRCLRFNEEF